MRSMAAGAFNLCWSWKKPSKRASSPSFISPRIGATLSHNLGGKADYLKMIPLAE